MRKLGKTSPSNLPLLPKIYLPQSILYINIKIDDSVSISITISTNDNIYHLLPEDDTPQPVLLPALLAHSPEHALPTIPVPELPGRAVLGDPAVAQHQDPVEVGDGAQPVGDDEERGVGELLADAPLDQGVGGHVHGRGGLVEDHDPRAGDDGARQAEELALALGEVQAAFGDGAREVAEDVGVGIGGGGGGGRRRGDGGRGAARAADEVHALEGVAQRGVGVPAEGVEVAPDGAGEEDGVLRYDCQARAQVVQLDGGDVQPVDVDAPGAGLEEAEERQGQGALARAGAADDADALVVLDAEGEPVEHGREVRSIADYQLVDLDGAAGGPGGRWAHAFEGLGRQFGVLDDSY